MNELDKYHDPAVGQDVIDWQLPPDSGAAVTSDLVVGILRRWYIMLLVFLLMCAVGVPAVWLVIKPAYEVVGAVRVAPITEDIITGAQDPGEIEPQTFFALANQAIKSGFPLDQLQEIIKSQVPWREKHISLQTAMAA